MRAQTTPPDLWFARISALPSGAQAALAAGLGAISALGQPPVSLWIFTLLGIGGLFGLVAVAATARRAAWCSWLFGTAYFAVALRWLVEPFQVEADVYGWMAPFALALMAGGLALFWAVAGVMAYRLGAGSWRHRLAALVFALSAVELARGYVMTGFPWAGFAQIWIDHGIAQSLAWVGPQGLGLLTLALVALPVALRGWSRVAAFVGVAALVALLANFEIPLSADDDSPVVRVVQPNAPQQEKWDPERAGVFFWRQVDATAAGRVPDLIVWPETSLPQILRYADDMLEIVSEAARGATVALGVLRDDGYRGYNSLAVLDADGEVSAVYDKHHLVPFGEYMPLPGLFRSLGIRGLAERADTGYARGPGPAVIAVGPLRALPLICYEAVFPRNARVSGDRPDLLLQVTNDAWFGTYAGPQQHLAQARMRAIEQGLPLVRAANTGISAVIGPRGQMVASMPLGTHGHVDAKLPEPLPATVYARTGDWPVLILIAVVLGGLTVTAFTRNSD